LAGLATLAVSAGYCRPEITTSAVLDIREGRHPVLDRLKPSGEFVPNDVRMGKGGGPVNPPNKGKSAKGPEGGGSDEVFEHVETPGGLLQLITGPNMAGKSTYIRQAALLTIMAQMGSFVPAKAAWIGIADRVFARVGASDELGKGQSTFMVEMTETARILNAATSQSLVILDEIGRGTSTYDGISLAWAITEYLHDVTGCRTMFATHYHELTQLTQSLKECVNWNVAVREDADDVIFLHKIVPGSADKSYGIHVAQLAGVPRTVLDRAKVILRTLESDHVDESGRTRLPERRTKRKNEKQLALFEEEEHPIIDELRQMKVDQMTPMAALTELHRLQEKLK
jgi:DNA mismatch repair protein MutS